jgi:hypothetical protein
MYRKILVLHAFLLVSFFSFSQNMDIAWGPERDFRRASVDLGFVGKVKDHFYTLRREDKVMYLAKNRVKDMTQVWEKPIKWNEGRKNTSSDDNLTFKSFRMFKGNFVFYFEDYSRKDDIQRVYAQKIDFEGVAVDPLIELGSRVKERKNRDGSFLLVYSPDSTNFMLVTNPAYEKYSAEKFKFDVFSQKLEKAHSLELTLPFKDKNFAPQMILLDRSKMIHMLARIDVEKKERKDDEASHHYEIVTINPKDKNSAKEFEVSLDNKFVHDVDIMLDKKDNLKCFGFYGDLGSRGRAKGGIKGVFYFGLNAGKAGSVSVKELGADLVENIAGRRSANRKRGISSAFGVKYFLEKEDGGVMILAEDAFVREVTTCSQNGGCTTTYYYNYQSVLGVNIDPKGNIVWYAHVPKKQEIANDDRYGSFHAMYVKGKTYLIYNDHAKNAGEKSYDKEMNVPVKSIPVVVVITADGKSDKKLLGEVKGKTPFVMKPNAADKISGNQSFFYADRLGAPCCIIWGARRVKGERYGIVTLK